MKYIKTLAILGLLGAMLINSPVNGRQAGGRGEFRLERANPREDYHPRAREDVRQNEFNRDLQNLPGGYGGAGGVEYVPVNPYPPPPAPLEPTSPH